MPKRDVTIGAPCWIDLMSSDTDKSRAFYGSLFGWTSEADNPEFGGYSNFSRNGELIAGLMPAMPDAGPPNVWSVYICVADPKETCDKVEAHGGTVIAPPMDVADLGTMAVVTDNGGAAIGMWKPGTHKGFAVANEPGAPSWFELSTRDHDGAVRFYDAVFGWKLEAANPSPGFSYSSFNPTTDDQGFGIGIMDASGFLPEGMPSHWAFYFTTDNADATLAKVVELGGTVLQPAEDTPYGRLASAADATGAMFKLIQH
jgi:predicted enzyme related to lactoylglutathione lyase